MKYYKLIYDYDNDDNYINCGVGNIGNMDKYVMSNGILIKDWNSAVFEYNSNEGSIISDYIANVYRWLIVSRNFCTLIDEVVPSTLLQLLPVKIQDRASSIVDETYKVANILDVIDALDLENSQYDVFELDDDKVVSVRKYALKAEEVNGHDIFRFKNDMIPIFVSERIKRLIEENELLGFAFLEVAVN